MFRRNGIGRVFQAGSGKWQVDMWAFLPWCGWLALLDVPQWVRWVEVGGGRRSRRGRERVVQCSRHRHGHFRLCCLCLLRLLAVANVPLFLLWPNQRAFAVGRSTEFFGGNFPECGHLRLSQTDWQMNLNWLFGEPAPRYTINKCLSSVQIPTSWKKICEAERRLAWLMCDNKLESKYRISLAPSYMCVLSGVHRAMNGVKWSSSRDNIQPSQLMLTMCSTLSTSGSRYLITTERNDYWESNWRPFVEGWAGQTIFKVFKTWFE